MLSEIEFSKNVIHRDYTFSNVILSKNGKVFILDWEHIHLEKKNLIWLQLLLFLSKEEREIWENCIFKKNEKLDNVDREEVLKVLILAYVYIVERYDEVKKRVFIIESMK